MKKSLLNIYKITLLFILVTGILKAQQNAKHLLGVDFGFARSDDFILNYKIDVNVNYVFNYKLFIFKTQAGISPYTNFGNVSKLFLTAGFTSKLSKIVSFNLMLGIGFSSAENTAYNNFYYDPKNGGVLNSGLYLKPFKNEKIILGFNASIYDEPIYTRAKTDLYEINYVTRFNFSLNYVLSKKTNN